MTLSILHRISGIALFAALIGLTGWLLAAAAGAECYAQATHLATSIPARILIALALLALCFHFFNGLRHLAWDMGWGFERAQARRSAVIVVIATLLAVLLCLYALLRTGAGSA